MRLYGLLDDIRRGAKVKIGDMDGVALVILAAGMGSRYGGTKQLDAVTEFGETIIDFSIYDAARAGFSKVVFVVRESILEECINNFGPKLGWRIDVEFVCQRIEAVPKRYSGITRRKPWGTGHALLSAREAVSGNFCVINADDFYGRKTFEMMRKHLHETDRLGTSFSLAAFILENTLSENGTVSRGECFVDGRGFLKSVVERTAIEKSEGRVHYRDGEEQVALETETLVSMNFWGFTPQVFDELALGFEKFLNERAEDVEAEYFLPAAVDGMIKSKTAAVKVLTTDAQWLGVTYMGDRERVAEEIKKMKEQGEYPKRLWD